MVLEYDLRFSNFGTVSLYAGRACYFPEASAGRKLSLA